MDIQDIQVNMLKKGERFKLHPGDERVFIRRDYVFKENKYACSPLDEPQGRELLAGKTKVFKVLVQKRQEPKR